MDISKIDNFKPENQKRACLKLRKFNKRKLNSSRLYVIIMQRMRFRVNLQSLVA